MTARPRLVVIGNGMATSRLLDELLAPGTAPRFSITVYGEERHGSYNRIMLGVVLAGRSPEEIETKPARWYAERGVRFVPGVRVTGLDPRGRRVLHGDGHAEPYDVAVLATGSTAVVPAIPGASGPGVHVFRTIEDGLRLRSHACQSRRAVVVGGGVLGLEAAKALVDLGLDVTVVHRSEVLMNAQLDAPAAALVRGSIEALSIRIVVGEAASVERGTDGGRDDEENQRVRALTLADGRRLPTDLVVFAIGVRPRTELAAAAGLAVKRGILVDDRLETSAPAVHALGECAEHAGTTYGLVAPCWEQAQVLARVLGGGTDRYVGSRVYTRLKVAGLEVASMGQIEAAAPEDEVVEVIERRRGVYRKLVSRGGRLLGAIVVGDPDGAAAAVRAFDRGDPLPERPVDFFCSGAGYESKGGAGAREICNCRHVDEAALASAIEQGCRSVAALGERTGAGTGCGSCKGALARLLDRRGAAAA